MSFESFDQNPIESPLEIEKTSKVRGITDKAKKVFHSLVLGAALSHSAEAADLGNKQETVTNHSGPDIRMESQDLQDDIEIQAIEGGFKWGIQYVPKKTVEHGDILAMRYVKINEHTGVQETLGEFDNLIQAAEGISKIQDMPQNMKKLIQHNLGAINTERAFQASGMVEGVKNPIGKTHIEDRTFKGYGIEAHNKVEVDEQGNVVKLVDSKNNAPDYPQR